MSFSLRSRLLVVLSALVLSALLAGAAGAVPTYSFLYSGTSGSGTTGGSTIEALPGDVITLDVLIHTDEDGLSGWDFDLLGSGVLALSGQECPAGSSGGSTSNFFDGGCYTGASIISPIQAGVTLSGSDILHFDAGTITPYNGAPVTLFAARGVFQVTGAGDITLSGDGADGAFGVYPLQMVPEPTTGALLALGLAALARRAPPRRRRRTA